MHTRCGTMTITRLHICLPWVNSKWLQRCKPQWLSSPRSIWHPTWHLKVESRHQNGHQIYNIQNSGRLNSEKETYLWRTHSIIGISQKRHRRWRLLLWHRGRANNTSRASWHQGCWLNHSTLIQCYRKPNQGKRHSH